MNYTENLVDVQKAVYMWFNSIHIDVTTHPLFSKPFAPVNYQEFIEAYNQAIGHIRQPLNPLAFPPDNIRLLKNKGYITKNLVNNWDLVIPEG